MSLHEIWPDSEAWGTAAMVLQMALNESAVAGPARLQLKAIVAHLNRIKDETRERERGVLTTTQTPEVAARSTPVAFYDGQHMYDARGQLWCYNELTDTWGMREQPTTIAQIAWFSVRSYQRLVAEFGPLRPYEDERRRS